MQEFVFPKEELRRLIEESPDSEQIAIRIRYDFLEGSSNSFKATITAAAVSPSTGKTDGTNPDIASQFPKAGNGRPLSSAMDTTSSALMDGSRTATMSSTSREVSGCPNPPGCR